MSFIMYLSRISKQQLQSYVENPALYYNREDDDTRSIDIDRAWSGIMYLLTGKSFVKGSPEQPVDSINRIIFSEQYFDEEAIRDLGTPSYLTPEQVAGIYKKIAPITKVDFRKNYNPEVMSQDEKLYAFDEWSEEVFEYLYDYFQILRSFFATAASNGEAIVSTVG